MRKSLLFLAISLMSMRQVHAQCPDLSTPRKTMASSFHSSVMIDYTGAVVYWGDGADPVTAGTDILSPLVLTGYTGTPLSVAAGSVGASEQHALFLHTTTNIYGWGYSNKTINNTATGNVTLSPITLPAGVSISNVNFIEGSACGLVIVTNSGAVYVKQGGATGGTYTALVYGDGSTGSTMDVSWHRVKKSALASDTLTGVTRISCAPRGMMALTASGNIYVWGENVLIGDGTTAQDLAYATLVTNPSGVTPNDINIDTKFEYNTFNNTASQFVLGTNGKMYAVGENHHGPLGQGNETDATNWLTVKGPGLVGTLDNVVEIGSNNPFMLNNGTADDASNGGYAIGALTSSGEFYLWGDNNSDMVGGDTLSSPTKDSSFYTVPRIPPNFSLNYAQIGFFEIGGHTTAAFLAGTSKFCYIGHKVRGSMGDGTSATSTRKSFDCINTPEKYVCPPAPTVGCPLPTASDLIASSNHATLVINGTPSVSFWGEGASSAEPGINLTDVKTLYEYTGTPIGVAASAVSEASAAQGTQMWIHTDQGIWGWGYSANTIIETRAGSSPITSVALPSGVAASDVNFIRSSRGGIAIVTHAGNVWVRAGANSVCSPNVYGDGSSALDIAGSTIWHQVKTAVATPLTNVIELSFGGTAAIAITASGSAYVWGDKTYLGNSTAAANRAYASLMTLHSDFTGGIKPRTAEIIQSGSLEAVQFILGNNNKVYSIGRNANGALGNGTASTTAISSSWNALSLVGIRKLSSNNPFANGYYSIGALNLTGNVLLWGSNNGGMLGQGASTDILTPTAASTITSNDASNFDIGGHQTIIFSKSLTQFYFAGHSTGGSKADGTSTSTTNTSFALAASVANCANVTFNLSGNLYKDINGLNDNLVNGNKISSIKGAAMYANLLDESGYVIASTPIVAGSYTFNGFPYGTYQVQISTTAGSTFALAPITTLPSGYTYGGDQIGTSSGTGIDAKANGIIDVALASNITNVNFGVTPAPPVASNISAPSMDNMLAATSIPSLQASSPINTPIDSFFVLTIPNSTTQGTLSYCTTPPASGCGTPVTAGLKLSKAQSKTLSFDPLASYTGNVVFTYQVKDTNGLVSNTANYTIPVFNNPPVTMNVSTAQMTNTDTPSYLPEFIVADADGTVDSIIVSSIPPTSEGVLSYCSNGTEPCTGSIIIITNTTTLTRAQAITVKLDPDPSFTGDYIFHYVAKDNNGNLSNTSTFTVPIVGSIGGNLPPVATNITAQNINNSLGATPIPNLLGTDPDGSITKFTLNSIPNPTTQGTLYYCASAPTACTIGTLTAANVGDILTIAQAQTLQFDPLASFIGTASFSYTTTDNGGTPLTSAAASYDIPVVNIPPVANPDKVAAIANTVITPTLLPSLSGSDYDGTIVSFNITNVPATAQGTLKYCAGPGTCTPATLTTISGPISGLSPAQVDSIYFIPNSSYVGDYVFNFTTVDNNNQVSQVAPFTIPVVASAVTIGQPPIANNFNNTPINSTTSASLTAALLATDPDGTIANYTISSLPASKEGALTYCTTPPTGCGTSVALGLNLTASQAATLLFTPNANFTGTSTFNYSATDNDGNLSNNATVTIPVVNNPPIANNINNTSISRSTGATTLNPLVSSDVDGTVVGYKILSLPSAEEGVLKVCTSAPSTGCTAVTLNQVLTGSQISNLTFTPNPATNSPIVTFLYATSDNSGNISNTAAVNIPLFDALPLPLELLSFSASKQYKNALIEWTTTNEQNAITYQLQYSIDGRNWSMINSQEGKGQTNLYHTYSYLHNHTVNGINLYRLNIIEADGNNVYSSIRSVLFDHENTYTVMIQPNPVSDKLTLSTSDGSIIEDVVILSNEGKKIQSFKLLPSGSSIDMSNYASGLYFIKITDQNGTTQVVKISKK
jgi:alpha-tubulin suppressor-like RCC1 family protein